MEEKTFKTQFRIYNSPSELPEDTQILLRKAHEARKQAYAPYSDFFVGAALRLSNQKIITGNNQENAAYPSGLCAERVALFYAKSNFPDADVKEICVATDSPSENPSPPCGSCRQVLMEYELQQEQKIPVYFAAKNKVYSVKSTTDLLPFAFNKKFL